MQQSLPTLVETTCGNFFLKKCWPFLQAQTLNWKFKLKLKSLDSSLNHSDPFPFLSLDPSLENVIDILKVLIPVRKREGMGGEN